MDDQKIIKLLWQRAESAIEALSKRFGTRLMWIATNILGTHQDAEETVNDTYLAVWNTIPPKKPDPLAGYVHATGRNISLDRLKYNTAQNETNRTWLTLTKQPSIKDVENMVKQSDYSVPSELKRKVMEIIDREGA